VFAEGDALLVPPGDAAALAAALRGLRDDRAALERIAAAGRACYEARFAPDAVADRFLAALRDRGLLPAGSGAHER